MVLSLTTTLVLVSCGGDDTGSNDSLLDEIDALRSQITVSPMSGVKTDGIETARIEVVVVDENENPIPGAQVRIEATGDGNTFTPQVATSDADGVGVIELASTVEERKTLTAFVGFENSAEEVEIDAHPTVGFGRIFSTETEFSTGSESTAIVVEDFNADGLLDIATTIYATSKVAILDGRGDGTFSAPRNFDTGSDPLDILAIDVDDDGNLDVVTANSDDDSISILLGDGNGNFAANDDYAVGDNPRRVIAADLDDDGKVDLAVTNYLDQSVTILVGDGTGSFSRLYGSPIPGAEVRKVYFLTGDCSGDPYVFAPISTDNTAYQDFFGNPLQTSATHINAYAVKATDSRGVCVDEGATYDLIEADYSNVLPELETGQRPLGISASDFNNDGRLDLVVASSLDNKVGVYFGLGSATFSSPQEYQIGSNSMDVLSGDLNKDDFLDFAVSNSIFEGVDGSVFGEKSVSGMASNSEFTSADLNGDGNVDLVSRANATISVFLGDGEGNFDYRENYTVLSGSGFALGDVSGDGLVDLIANNGSANNVAVFLGK